MIGRRREGVTSGRWVGIRGRPEERGGKRGIENRGQLTTGTGREMEGL